jgi:hypothetical protein
MKIEGCETKEKHLFVGSKTETGKEEAVSEIKYVEACLTESLLGSLKSA